MALLVLCGPTASGKSAVALELAQRIGAEIVSADSMQIYRGLDIGTAKPTRKQRESVPHHLIDIVEVEEVFSAGRFGPQADERITDIQRRGKPVIVCGGSMLYLKALLRGLAAPEADPELRGRLEAQTTEALREQLQHVDTASAQRLHPHDRVRILRALEITLQTGKPASELRAEHSFSGSRHEAIMVALTLPREELHAQINSRVEEMIEAGLLGETRWLLDRSPAIELPPMKGLGYRQLIEHLHGETSLDEAVSRIAKQTRVFARRQLTWLRSEPSAHRASTREQALDLLLRAHESPESLIV